MNSDEAKAWYDEFKATRTDSTAVIMTPGAYEYAEGIRFKTKKDIEDAVKASPRIVPVYCAHDEKKLVGAAYNIRYEDGKAIADIYHEQGLRAGDGVSPGFTTREVQCNEGVCQTDMKIFHVAADPALDPRHDQNRVIQGDSKMAEDLKTQLDAKTTELEQVRADHKKLADDAVALKTKLDAYEKKEREDAISTIASRLKKDTTINFDGITIDGLKKIIEVQDSTDASKADKPFFTDNGKKPEPIRGNL